ncbi:MAG: outer membrane protein transport protein [Cellvibrionaceae bacterium]
MKLSSRIVTATLAVASITSFPSTVFATSGYFRHGYGHNSAAMAGATTATAQDAMAGATNPAVITQLDNQSSVNVSLFNPLREFQVTGQPQSAFSNPVLEMPLALGTTESDENYFAIPTYGYKTRFENGWDFNFVAYGQGGMNTSYSESVFGGGKTGVDMAQLFFSFGFAKQFSESTAVGIAPILGYQRFEVEGLAAFAGMSQNPSAVSNRGYADAWGYGVRLGLTHKLSEKLTFGLSYQTILDFESFDEYEGLFADDGLFDIPTTYNLGFAYERGDVTWALDYQHIDYSEVASVANSMMPAFGQIMMGNPDYLLGKKQGPGFGWESMDVYKLGVAMKDGKNTWRAGISYGEQPIPESEVLFNIIAPGVQEWHYTLGYEFALQDGESISVSFMYSPENSVKGIHPANQQQWIELSMEQFELTIGYNF